MLSSDGANSFWMTLVRHCFTARVAAQANVRMHTKFACPFLPPRWRQGTDTDVDPHAATDPHVRIADLELAGRCGNRSVIRFRHRLDDPVVALDAGQFVLRGMFGLPVGESSRRHGEDQSRHKQQVGKKGFAVHGPNITLNRGFGQGHLRMQPPGAPQVLDMVCHPE